MRWIAKTAARSATEAGAINRVTLGDGMGRL
jgi:hypothetical protein